MSEEFHRAETARATRSVFEAARKVDGRFRQRYHFMAPAYWLNDPNGLIRYGEKYHLFYQHNPYAAKWGPMCWGHAVSTDLVRWEHMPVALAPSEPYEQGKFGGCFSGSAVEADGRLVLMYTGASYIDGVSAQAQCLAFSSDGVHFEKYAGNPVLARPGEAGRDFRDPKVWRQGDSFFVVVAARDEEGGEALLFESKDLVRWEARGTLARSGGRMGSMWECPDFFELDGTGVLFFSPIGFEERKACYLTGKFDSRNLEFSPTVLGETDWGFDFYAAQSFRDDRGRRIVIGWANGWDWMPWWNGFGPTQQDLWCGYMSLPREVSVCADGSLAFQPVEELKTLRSGARKYAPAVLKARETKELLAGDGVAFELDAHFDLRRSTAASFSLLVRCSETECTRIECDLAHGRLNFDRSASDGFGSSGVRTCPLKAEEAFRLHVFSDTCSVEVFAGDGKTVMCSSVYPSSSSTGIRLLAEGGELYTDEIFSWGMALDM